MWTAGARTGVNTFIWSTTGAALDNALFETGHDPSTSHNRNKLCVAMSKNSKYQLISQLCDEVRIPICEF